MWLFIMSEYFVYKLKMVVLGEIGSSPESFSHLWHIACIIMMLSNTRNLLHGARGGFRLLGTTLHSFCVLFFPFLAQPWGVSNWKEDLYANDLMWIGSGSYFWTHKRECSSFVRVFLRWMGWLDETRRCMCGPWKPQVKRMVAKERS